MEKINKWNFVLLFVFSMLSFTFIEEAPAIKNKKQFRIAVISDLNSSYGSTTYHPDVAATLKELDSIKPDLILCAGDMVAGQKKNLTAANIAEMWQSFKLTILSPVTKMGIPFAFTVGNHDASPTYSTDREMAKQFWIENKKALSLNFVDDQHFPFFFSYIKNDVFFISWDAAGSAVKPEVYEWMKLQLQSKAAKKAKLRILLGHLPLYAIVDSKNKAGEVLANTKATSDFFIENGVDLYISGHQHAYYPSQMNGLRLLNAGCIGEGPRQLIGDQTPATRAYTLIDIPLRSAQKFTYKTFVPNQHKEIALHQLPDSVIGFNGISKRERAPIK